jgi:hypothetical protein
MGKRYNEISQKLQSFIEEQKIYFVATAAADGRVNVSPKGMDSLRVLDANRVVWLNITGSGNETAAHVAELPRMTLMFCSFNAEPMILRLYGEAREIQVGDPEWNALYSLFTPLPGARQIFDMKVDLVQTSCGFAVPFFEYQGEREMLKEWVVKKGPEGIEKYWHENNSKSLDGKPIKTP